MSTLPPLVIIGDADLMRPQPAVENAALDTPQFQQKLEQLRHAMVHYQGIGIAAPQIGWAARVFCLGIDNPSSRYPQAPAIEFGFWINPEMTAASRKTVWAWEGCLSVPGMRGWVERPAEIQVYGLDERGQPREARFAGFAARVWQHEFDHLDGVLYPQRVSHGRWLVPEVTLQNQHTWPSGWPSPGAAATPPGQLCDRA